MPKDFNDSSNSTVRRVSAATNSDSEKESR
jgi:hypothetical protein